MENEQVQIEVWENEGGLVEKRDSEDAPLPRKAADPVIEVCLVAGE